MSMSYAGSFIMSDLVGSDAVPASLKILGDSMMRESGGDGPMTDGKSTLRERRSCHLVPCER